MNIQTYPERAKKNNNPIAKRLLELMGHKETNLVVANDLTDPEKMLTMADTVGSEIVILKTHIDIVTDFTPAITDELTALAKKHNFLIFEDRKFADIGNTVKMQYEQGIYHIARWADLTNAHIIPGFGIIEGLYEVAQNQSEPRGLILLAQMSSKGNLATDDYTKAAIAMAKEYQQFVMGFIGNGGDTTELKKLAQLAGDEFIILAPGVKLGGGSDSLKQQYTTPADVIEAGADAIIVGRGIYGADDPLQAAKEYRTAGWQAYQQRIN
ncbi:MAG: orotidine-5'-phosphate decarboxylase [Thermodesulfovibrionia bacterium]|nr:orotidine-5'-phosphate decarboxylase [Thermodesulfovibrionia bacterium]